jgi:TonB family protein
MSQRQRRRGGLRPGLVGSVLLHLGFIALVVLAALSRPRPPEPLPPPAYEVQYQSGAPDRPGEEQADAQATMEAPPPAPEAPPSVPQPAAPPPPPLATAPPSLPLPPTPPPSPRPPQRQQTAEATPPPPPPPTAEPLPMPPPPPPAPPREAARQEQALNAPPTPARPAPPRRLPGVWMPEALALAPPSPPSRPNAPRSRLDLSLGPLASRGRNSPDSEATVRGAEVGPDWRNAFSRWVEEHKRYPENAIVAGHQGPSRVQVIAEPDGKVRSVRLIGPSGSVWLDAGTVSMFRNAVLPAFPPGSDPKGVTIDFTMNYILIR